MKGWLWGAKETGGMSLKMCQCGQQKDMKQEVGLGGQRESIRQYREQNADAFGGRQEEPYRITCLLRLLLNLINCLCREISYNFLDRYQPFQLIASPHGQKIVMISMQSGLGWMELLTEVSKFEELQALSENENIKRFAVYHKYH
ncbi:hypothetical protein DUI87_15449 [Hirundo rustica rustica]|uniref:Uncharacterized protein n=1 Tax=Hirundo rustica rustica TaxID=333673 RepID=A0A3M0KL94_HIRRU|nr:hypothetical protein DUI87_15449 [Hirundo rustica rustica]